MKIYHIIPISRKYCTLLIFHVASLSLNNCFNAPEKRCLQIRHHLLKYETPFSMAELPQLNESACILLTNSLFVSTCTQWYWNEGSEQAFFLNQILLCCTRSVVWNSVMLRNLTFIRVRYQIILQQLDELSSILPNFLEPSLFMYPQSIRLFPQNFTVFVV